MSNERSNETHVVSYLTLRKMIGILGIALPLICLFYAFIISVGGKVENSISAYYHTGIRDFFVGILWAAGVFMLAYTGYDKRDRYASNIAGSFAILVALFSTDKYPLAWDDVWIRFIHRIDPTENYLQVDGFTAWVHTLAAAGLFIAFAYMSLKLFTITGDNPTTEKLKRNKVFQACGWIIVACIAIMVVQSFWNVIPQELNPVFWLEMISLFAFGTSWLTKGEAIFADQKATEDGHDQDLSPAPVPVNV